MDIFVGNLSFDANEGDVKLLFEGFGNVASVAIVRRNEKKAPKSRGFGFVQMPDERQALAAIAALGGREFMGRALIVSPARPKPAVQAGNELRQKRRPLAAVEARQYPVFNKHLALKAPRPNGRAGTPSSAVDRQVRPLGQPGTYRGGRRTRSYINRRGLAGMQEEAKPRQRSQDNPMRWRKRKGPGERPQESGFNPSASPFDKFRTRPERSRRPSPGMARRKDNGRSG